MAPKVLKSAKWPKSAKFYFSPLLRVFLYIRSADSMQIDQKESTESESNSSGEDDDDFDPGNDNNEDSDDEDDGNASDHEVAVPDSSTLARKRVLIGDKRGEEERKRRTQKRRGDPKGVSTYTRVRVSTSKLWKAPVRSLW